MDDCRLTPGSLYVELGCGDGRLVAAAAKRGAKAIGYEINPLMWLVSKIRCFYYPNAKIKLGNFWQANLRSADAVFVFLMPRFMEQLENKTVDELKSGARLISYIYELPNTKPMTAKKRWFVYKY